MLGRIQRLERMVRWLYCKVKNTSVGGIQSIVAGENITVDNTDPANPVVSSTGGGTEQDNFNRIPSATYAELGITPESTVEEKQTAITTFLEGYDNAETDNLFFEIKEDVEPQYNFDVVTTNEYPTEESFTQRLIDIGNSGITINNFINIDGRIRCNMEMTDSLNLSEMGITYINIITLGEIEELSLAYNQISSFNPTIALPTSLKRLFLYGNQIIEFNPTIALPNGLERLSLDDNQIIEFNPTIALPTSLKRLELSGNQISSFNPTIALPIGLQELYLGYNNFTYFNMPELLPISLQVLNFDNNKITDWSLSEPWANLIVPQSIYLFVRGNLTSATGTNFKTILESKGYNVTS